MSVSRLHLTSRGQGGFTLVEVLTIIVIIGALWLTVVPWVLDSFTEAKDRTKMANVKMLNDAALRATIQGKDPQGAGLIGSDEEAAVEWYKGENLIENQEVSYEGLLYYFGYWYVQEIEDVENYQLLTPISPADARAALVLAKGQTSWEALQAYYQSLADADATANGDLTAYLRDNEGGVLSLEELAERDHGGEKYKEITPAEIAELVSRLSELSFTQSTDLINAILLHPTLSVGVKGNNLIEISNAINQALASGTARMSADDLNAALLEVVTAAGQLPTA